MRVGQTSAIHFIANVTSSVAGLFATIYLTRNLNESLLGKYFLVVALLIWATVVLGRPFQSAVTKRLSESDDGGYLSAGILIQIGIFVLFSVLLLVFREQVNTYTGVDATFPLIALFFVTTSYKFVTAGLQGERRTHVAAILQPVNVGSRSVFQIVAAVLGLGVLGLLAGYGIAVGIATVIGVVYLHTSPKTPTRAHFHQLVSFARYSWLGTISSRAFSSLDTIVLGMFVAKSFITYYEIAWNLASIFAIFGVGISRALFPEISKLSDEKNTSQVETLVEDSLAFSGLFLIPGFIGSLIIGDLVLQIYGPQYAVAAEVLGVLIFARLTYAYAGQLTTALDGIDRPDLSFRVNAAFITVNVGLNLLLVYLYGWLGAAVATTVSAIVSLGMGYWYLKDLVTVKVPFSELSRQWIAALLMAFVVAVGRNPLATTWLTGVVLAGVGGGVYFGSLYLLSARFRTTVRENAALS